MYEDNYKASNYLSKDDIENKTRSDNNSENFKKNHKKISNIALSNGNINGVMYKYIFESELFIRKEYY